MTTPDDERACIIAEITLLGAEVRVLPDNPHIPQDVPGTPANLEDVPLAKLRSLLLRTRRIVANDLYKLYVTEDEIR